MDIEIFVYLGMLCTGLLGSWFFRCRSLNTLVAWLTFPYKLLIRDYKRRKEIDVEENKTKEEGDKPDGTDGVKYYRREENTPNDKLDIPDVCVVENADYRYRRNPSFKYPQRVRYLDEGMCYRGGIVEWTGRRNVDGSEVVVISTDEYQGIGDLVGKAALPVEFSMEACPAGYHMLPAEEAEGISDYKIGDFCFIRRTKTSRAKTGGFLRDRPAMSFVVHRLDKNFKDIRDSDDLLADDFHLVKVPPPETEAISSEYIEPVTGNETKYFCGRNKGIQGKGNSCYLDSLIFSFFAYSDAFDYILKAEDDDQSPGYLEVLNTLRYDIVYPLRLHQFVSHHNVQRLRQSIARQVQDDSYLSEARDIPECLEVLFGRLLNVQPLVHVGHYVQDGVQFNGVYSVEVFNVGGISYPTSEELLRRSAVLMEFCLKTTTKCLFLQIAREDGRKVNVFPSIDIDLKDLCYDTAKVCTKCRCQATMQFWKASPDIGGTFFCDDCARSNGFDLQEGLRLPEVDLTSAPEEDTLLTLVGVLCIERSHFNCFARCGMLDRWVFFDSMRDQEAIFDPDKGCQQDVNIPCVKEIPDFQNWLKSAQSELKSNPNSRSFRNSMNAEDFEIASRIFTYPSFFIYRRITDT